MRDRVAALVPRSFDGADDDTRRRARLIVQFALVIFLCGPAYGALYLSLGMFVSAAGAGLCAVALGFTPLLFRRFASISFGAHWVTLICYVVLGMVTVPTGGLAAPAVAWLALIPVTALMLGGRRIGGVWTAISLASAIAYLLLDLAGLTPPSEAPARWLPLLRTMVAAGLIGLIALLAWLYEANKDRMLADLRRAGDEVAQARDQYRALVESTRCIPWEYDPLAARFTYVGPQAGSLLGCPSNDWLAAGFLPGRYHPDDPAPPFPSAPGEERVHQDLEFRLRRDDGGWVWVRSIAGAATGDARLRGIILDITERRELELELRQAQKLESVGRLAAGIAHEINTPVQFVTDSVMFLKESYAELVGLLEGYQRLRESSAQVPALAAQAVDLASAEESADLEYLVENIPQAAERAVGGLERVAAIVRSMKQFAHPDGPTKANADLNQALAATVLVARNEYRSVAEVDLDLGELPPVSCHLGQLNQVFLNILVNAAHAVGEVIEGTEQRGRITIRSRREEGAVAISIADTGPGIPAAIQHQIFDPFFTTKPVGKGTGQGLAIARSIVVDRHGGSLTFETAAGRGTTFIIRLPLASTTLAA